MCKKPNVIVLMADQWRASATGYAGDRNVYTPHLDSLAKESVNFTTAVSACPVCSPYRASFLTGQYPLTHGVFVNDVHLQHRAVSLADVFNDAGYNTAYIGKWHLEGNGRSSYIPKEHRQGFRFWKALECTHNYHNSYYYSGDDERCYKWEGYDAFAQTEEAISMLEGGVDSPFLLILSWGPPHNPYDTAPEFYRRMYAHRALTLSPNVPDDQVTSATVDLAGYYAHISALDAMVGRMMRFLAESALAEDTILLFTSDHGDMLGSHGEQRKQRPWDESILVPFLLRYPRLLGTKGCTFDVPINSPDIMPTLLGLCGIAKPDTVEGIDYTPFILGEHTLGDRAALVANYHCFGEWTKEEGGREYRGIRTKRYTYIRTLRGPWLLYDNLRDPYQLRNLCNTDQYADTQTSLDRQLSAILREQQDDFLPGHHYINKWGYVIDESGTVPYSV